MKKAVIALTLLLATSFALFTVAPVLAKPETVTITVKNSEGKPVVATPIYLMKAGDGFYSYIGSTDPHGKINYDISTAVTNLGWKAGDTIGVYVTNSYIFGGTITLSNQLSGRIAAKL